MTLRANLRTVEVSVCEGVTARVNADGVPCVVYYTRVDEYYRTGGIKVRGKRWERTEVPQPQHVGTLYAWVHHANIGLH